ncbi:hypothetical protein DL96DRAFT_1821340 [Flagelloscypha sp. PMI_526]|nr:hypothetical protein DL96DRAFT_1821340 [Flagelloscypha sp. PMI_526]
MSRPELPADILPQVFWQSEDIETVFRCASVSQVWRVQALPVLFDVFGYLILIHDSRDKRNRPQRLLTLFTEIWPDQTHHVRHVSIFLYRTSSANAFQNDTRKLLEHLPAVRSLGISGSNDLGLAQELAKFEGVSETKIFPSLTSIRLSSFGTIPLDALLVMCPILEKLELSGKMIADSFLETELCRIPKSHPLHNLILWGLRDNSQWTGMIRRHYNFVSYGLSWSDMVGGTPFMKTVPWLHRLSENLQVLDIWETLFFELVISYVRKNLSQSPANNDDVEAFELKSFPRLQSFRSAVALPRPRPSEDSRIEIAAFFMDWLAQQVSSLPPFHPLKKIGLDVVILRECPWGHFVYWDGENPPMPTTWSAMDVAFSQREPPVRAEYSLDYCMNGIDKMKSFVRGALPSLRGRQLLEVEVSYED